MRAIRLFLWFVVGVLIAAIPIFAYASDTQIDATLSTSTTRNWTAVQFWWGSAATYDAACSAYTTASATRTVVTSGSGTVQCKSVRVSDGYTEYRDASYTLGVCPSGTIQTAQNSVGVITCTGNVYSCPTGQNWTLSGTTCTRPACVLPQTRVAATGLCEQQAKKCYSLVVTPTGSCVMPGACVDGQQPDLSPLASQALCSDAQTDKTGDCAGGVIIGRTASGKALCITQKPEDADCTAAGGTITGTLNGKNICSKATNPICGDGSTALGTANGQPVCADTCPAGTAKGTFNGVSSCWPVGAVTNKKTDQKSTSAPSSEESSTNGGTPVVKTDDSATTCDGDKCTTRKTSTDGSGNTVTTVKTEEQQSFCAANPNSTLCRAKTECEENPKLMGCLEAGTTEDQGAIATKTTGVGTFAAVNIGVAAGSCPADVTLPGGAALSWQPSCNMATMLRPLLIALAWLAGAYIVMGGFVKKG